LWPVQSVSLRASGIARYVGAAFLAVWLVGWVIGEAVALGFLTLLLRSAIASAAGAARPIPGGEWTVGGAAGAILLFLLVWLTLWTIGGVAAIRELLRSVAGEDRVAVGPAGLELVRRAGPLRQVLTFERAGIRRVRLRHHDQAVVVDTAAGTEVVTTYGTADERRGMRDWLRRHLLLPDADPDLDLVAPPPGWTMTIEHGATTLSQPDPRTRRIRALVVWLIAALLGLFWIAALRTGELAGVLVTSALMLLIGWSAVWTTWSRREWLVDTGRLTLRRRFAGRERVRTFRAARLEVGASIDSDNDSRYELKVVDAQGQQTITTALHDEADIVDLGRWLAARTGFRLSLPPEIGPPRIPA
jgi:hypothetical protein